MIQTATVWLATSVVLMLGMSIYVIGSGRRRKALAADSWESPSEPENVHRLSDKLTSTWAPADDREPTPQSTVFALDGDLELEVTPERATEDDQSGPAVTGVVDSDSAVIERLLAGVTLPCGLERIVPADHDAERLAFVTSGHSPGFIAVSVADELERLGLEIEPLDRTEARVWRDGFELALNVHLEPRSVIRSRKAVFAHAPRDSVVIEFTVA